MSGKIEHRFTNLSGNRSATVKTGHLETTGNNVCSVQKQCVFTRGHTF